MQSDYIEQLSREIEELRAAPAPAPAPVSAAQEAEALQLMEQLQKQLASQSEGVSTGLKDQLTSMQNALKEEIQRQVASAAAGAKVGAVAVDTSTYLDSLFRDDMQMETNITTVKSRKTTAGGAGKLSDSLKKLQKLKGGDEEKTD